MNRTFTSTFHNFCIWTPVLQTSNDHPSNSSQLLTGWCNLWYDPTAKKSCEEYQVGSAHNSTTCLARWSCSCNWCSSCSLIKQNIVRDGSKASHLVRGNSRTTFVNVNQFHQLYEDSHGDIACKLCDQKRFPSV